MIDEQIARLAGVLQLEERIYRELAAVLRRERELILSLDAAGLHTLTAEKEALAAEGRVAEQSRIAVTEPLAAELGIRERPVTLRAICERLGDRDDRLREAQTRLVAAVGAVRELVEANRVLGGRRLSSVQATLKLLGRLVPVAAAKPGTPSGPTLPTSGRVLETSA